jgi:hypothetical protein
MARIVVLIVVGVLAAAPAAGVAAAPPPDPTQSPFQQAPPQNQIEEQPGETQAPAPAPAPQQTQLDDGSIGGTELLLIGVGIVALIGGIWFVIARDAKRVTAGRVPAADGGGLGGRSATRASRRSRRLSAAERRRRKRGRATK